MPALPTYRVEHRQPRRTVVLDLIAAAKPSRRILDPYVSRLIHDGKSGWVVLVNDTTGEVVTRRAIERTTNVNGSQAAYRR